MSKIIGETVPKQASIMICMDGGVHVSNFEGYFYVLSPQTGSLKHRAIQSINVDIDRIVIMLEQTIMSISNYIVHRT